MRNFHQILLNAEKTKKGCALRATIFVVCTLKAVHASVPSRNCCVVDLNTYINYED